MTGRTQVDRDEVQRWMNHIGAKEFVLPEQAVVTDPAMLIALAGKRCYQSFEIGLNPNISKIRSNYVDYFDNILKSGHGSVLEHTSYNFAIEGVSRVFTAEMNRHRAGWAISEGSLRFIRFGECIPYHEPDSIKGPEVLDDSKARYLYETDLAEIGIGGNAVKLETLDERKDASRIIFKRAFQGQEEAYRILEKIWADELAPTSQFHGKKQITSMMRRIVGLGVATGGMWTGNIRALRHVFAMRASEHAEEEMLHVFSRVARKMIEKEPLLFGDFTITPEGYAVPKYRKV